MITTFFILSAMFLAIFVLDIPLVFVVGKSNNARLRFITELVANLTASASAIFLLATLGLYFS